MMYATLCSGIEACSVAWHPLGWEPQFFSEIEPFPKAVLAHHYPNVPDYGDMTQYHKWNERPVDLICAGTPCQAFSVAGLREGLADPRGNLTLTFLGVLERYRPTWVVWENVPGVLSDRTNAFGHFLAGLGQLGYGFAYRVLDAQYFGVAQRRRRVFVVGYLGDWRPAAAVLFESDCLSGHPAPRRKAGEGASRSAAFGSGNDGEHLGAIGFEPNRAEINKEAPAASIWPAVVASTLNAAFGKKLGLEDQHINSNAPLFVPPPPVAFKIRGGKEGGGKGYLGSEDAAYTLSTLQDQHIAQPIPLNTQVITSHKAMGRGNGFGMGEQGDPAFTLLKAHSHAVAQPIYFGMDGDVPEPQGLSETISTREGSISDTSHAVAFAQNQRDEVRQMEVAGALAAEPGMKQQTYLRQGIAIRRLTPTECERLRGFPDGYTNIPWRGKPESPDGPRYKALGNSMAVPVMRWLGERIQLMNEHMEANQ